MFMMFACRDTHIYALMLDMFRRRLFRYFIYYFSRDCRIPHISLCHDTPLELLLYADVFQLFSMLLPYAFIHSMPCQRGEIAELPTYIRLCRHYFTIIDIHMICHMRT